MRVLIADDEPLTCKAISLCLPVDAEYDIALDGREAFEVFKKAFESGARHDVVFLDYVMPEIDGLEALKLIRDFEDERNVASTSRAIIIFTSSTQETSREMERSSNRVTFIAKPVSVKKLRTVLGSFGLLP